MNLSSFGDQQLPSVINDPFAKNKITQILVVYGQGLLGDSFSAWGTIEFKNGQTSGKQKFEGETFDEVVLKMKAVIEQLNSNV